MRLIATFAIVSLLLADLLQQRHPVRVVHEAHAFVVPGLVGEHDTVRSREMGLDGPQTRADRCLP